MSATDTVVTLGSQTTSLSVHLSSGTLLDTPEAKGPAQHWLALSLGEGVVTCFS